MKTIKILAIETSCDDTSVSELKASEEKGRLKKITALSNIISSQTELHAGYGGVYPMLAKREHQKNLPAVFAAAQKKFSVADADFIAVTKGPGLDPCLWTGINFAQELAKKYGLPLVGANHLEAHFLANLLTLGIGEEEFARRYLPAAGLVVSGGHTILFLAGKIGSYKILGDTLDDAAGECFDKAARILGLGYPGGPQIAKYAADFTKSGAKKKYGVKLPRPMMAQKNYNFSFSGLKTAVLYFHQKQAAEIKAAKSYLEEMSYGIQQAIIDVLVSKTLRAAESNGVKSVIIGGGVSSNEALRKTLKAECDKLGVKFLAPAPGLSVDNAAMAGVAGYFAWKRGEAVANPDNLKSDPNLLV